MGGYHRSKGINGKKILMLEGLALENQGLNLQVISLVLVKGLPRLKECLQKDHDNNREKKRFRTRG